MMLGIRLAAGKANEAPPPDLAQPVTDLAAAISTIEAQVQRLQSEASELRALKRLRGHNQVRRLLRERT